MREPITYTIKEVTKVSLELSQYLSEIGRKGGKAGGKARKESLTPEERSASAKKAAKARWAKKKEEKK